MADNFSTHGSGLASPATKAAAITPNDGADLANVARGIFVGVGGTIVLIAANDTAPVTFKGCAAGSVLPIRTKRVYSTGTTATDLVALE